MKLLSYVFLLAFLMTNNVFAAQTNITININGKNVSFTAESGYPFVDENNRTMVPLRATMDVAEASIVWHSNTQTAEVHKNGVTVLIPVNESYVIVNGNTVQNDAAAKIVNEKTYLPIRVVLESINFQVEWDSNLRTVFASDFVAMTGWIPYSTSDIKLLIENIAKGNVVYRDGQYWSSPEYSTMMANEEIIYSNDISNPDAYINKSDNNVSAYNEAPIAEPDNVLDFITLEGIKDGSSAKMATQFLLNSEDDFMNLACIGGFVSGAMTSYFDIEYLAEEDEGKAVLVLDTTSIYLAQIHGELYERYKNNTITKDKRLQNLFLHYIKIINEISEMHSRTAEHITAVSGGDAETAELLTERFRENIKNINSTFQLILEESKTIQFPEGFPAFVLMQN